VAILLLPIDGKRYEQGGLTIAQVQQTPAP